MRTVSDLKHAYEQNKDKEVKIFNPDTEDFTVAYGGVPYTIHSLEIAGFPYYVAQHIKNSLAALLMAKQKLKVETKADWQAIYDKIEVKYE
jgi:hypothetical protein